MVETLTTIPPEVQRATTETIPGVMPDTAPTEGQRGLRVTAMESVMGVDQNGTKKVGQTFRDAVQDRLDHPEDTTKTRVLARRHIFTELSGAAKGVDQILTSHQAEPIDNATLAKLLRPRIEAIYINQKGGKEVFEKLTDEEVIVDANDFAGTVARELFLGEYLNRVSKELSVKGEISEMCNQDPDVRINRGNLFKKVRQFMKARTRSVREIGRVSKRLKLGGEEQQNLMNAVKAQSPRSAAEYIQDENAVVVEAAKIKSSLEKKVIHAVTGDNEDPALLDSDTPLENTRHKPTFENIRKHEEAFSDAADAQAEYLSRRRHLADACQSLNPGLIAKAFIGMRQTELAYKVAKNSVRTIQRREARRFRLLSIAEDGKKQLETTTGILLGSPAGSLAKSVVAEAQALPGSMIQGVQSNLERLGHTTKEVAERPLNAFVRGVSRISGYLNRTVDTEVDRVAGFARNVKNEFHAWKGQPDIHGKMARSAAYFSYGNTGDISEMQAIQAEIAAAEQETASTFADTSLPVTEPDHTAEREASAPAAPVQEPEDSSADVSAAKEQPEDHSQANEQKHRFSLPFSFRNPFRRQVREQDQEQNTEQKEAVPDLSGVTDPTALPPDSDVASTPQSVEENQNPEIAASLSEAPIVPKEPEPTPSEEATATVPITPVLSSSPEHTSEPIKDKELAERYWVRYKGDREAHHENLKQELENSLERGTLQIAFSADEINDYHREKAAAYREVAKELGITAGEPTVNPDSREIVVTLSKPSEEPSAPTDSTEEPVTDSVAAEAAIPTLEHPAEQSSDSQIEQPEVSTEAPPTPTPIPTGESVQEAGLPTDDPAATISESDGETTIPDVLAQNQSPEEAPAETVTSEIAQVGEEVTPQQESGERRKRVEREMYNELVGSALGRAIVVLNEQKAAPESLAKVEEALRALESQEIRQRVESEGLIGVLKDSEYSPVFLEMAEMLREHAKTIKSTDYKKNDRIAANLLGGLALVGLENK